MNQEIQPNIVSPKTGGKIDIKKAYYNRDYIFPSINIDTIVLNMEGMYFNLKGYQFKKHKKIKK